MTSAVQQHQAARAQDFVQSIGVCAHIDLTNSSYGNENAVASQLKYLGISNVRAETPYANLSAYQDLGSRGIKFDLITATTNLGNEMSLIDKIAPYVRSVEGPNEVDMAPVSYNGQTGIAAAVAFQKDLYAAVHSDSHLAGVPVLAFSVSQNNPTDAYGDVSAWSDYGNAHAYAQGGIPPFWMLGYVVSHVTDTPGRTVIVTETGNYTMPDNNSGVAQDVQAKWAVDSLLENFSEGVPLTYLYQLEDGYADQPGEQNIENHWGLYNVDGTAKQSATALHNLTTLLGDAGPKAQTFAAGTLGYVIDGLPYYAFQNLFAKSDGTFDLALWSEPQIWDASTNTETAVAPDNVTVTLGQTAAQVFVYDVLAGTSPIATYANVSQIQLSLGSDPLIVKIVPPGAGSPPTIASIASAANSAPVRTGGTVTFTLTPSTALTLDTSKGAPSLRLSNGATATFDAAHSTPTSLVFVTTVTAGQNTADLRVTSLALGNARISDNAGNLLTATALSGVPGSDTGLAVNTAYAPVWVGTGPSVLAIGVSEDNWQGDAQFTIAVDGKQIGGVQTATAQHAAGQSQVFNVCGSFGAGSHAVTVSFLNDAYNGAANQDRNLYVDRITYAGSSYSTSYPMLSAGGASFTVAGSQPSPISVGTGPNAVVLRMSEDRWGGDAQFTVSVDGKQIGGALTTTALHAAGQSQAVTLNGTFGTGQHTVAVTFLNDAWGGTAATDRNLYVDSVSFKGATTSTGAALMGNGARSFTIGGAAAQAVARITPATVAAPSATKSLVAVGSAAAGAGAPTSANGSSPAAHATVAADILSAGRPAPAPDMPAVASAHSASLSLHQAVQPMFAPLSDQAAHPI